MQKLLLGIRQYRYNHTAKPIRRQKEREYLTAKKQGPCADCKQTFHRCQMDFDHVRGEKVFNVSQLYGKNIAVIEREIAKCDLVCANCHRLRTYRRSHVERTA